MTNNMDGGNEIQGIERYETKKTEKNGEKKPCYDKVMKILGLTEKELNENDWQT